MQSGHDMRRRRLRARLCRHNASCVRIATRLQLGLHIGDHTRLFRGHLQAVQQRHRSVRSRPDLLQFMRAESGV